MTAADITAAATLEHGAFEKSWPRTNFEQELRTNRLARYLVAEEEKPNGERFLAGFAGLWLMIDQAHVVMVAVDPRVRRRGIGRLLVYALLLLARDLDMADVTLEVRASNTAARALYRELGFWEVGERRKYYDNAEDAVIMTTDTIDSPAFARRLAATAARVEQDCPDVALVFSA